MANTTNFGWETPDDTDLVKDGAAAMRTLGNSIDTSFVDLKGGTTGQVLSKASNTDLDFTWVAQDDSNAIQNAIVDAKGDLISATAADTPARLAVGNNGETLVADSSATTGLRWQGNFAAGKNVILNGDMRIWQRGTSLALTSAQAGFLADRWSYYVGSTGAATISQQSFTAGTAPVAGYEAPFFLRMNQTTGTSGNPSLTQKIEDVRTFANQTVTVSFWMKASGSLNIAGVNLQQDFGSGGSTAVTTTVLGSTAITTSWARYTATISNPSISGKTIGTGSNLQLQFILPGSSTFTIDLWGVQVEAGSVATAFQTATGTLVGELAACQRYYYRMTSDWGGNYAQFGMATGIGTTSAYGFTTVPVRMRVAPTSVDFSTVRLWRGSTDSFAATNITLTNFWTNPYQIGMTLTTASGLSNNTFYMFGSDNSSSGYLGFSAEL